MEINLPQTPANTEQARCFNDKQYPFYFIVLCAQISTTDMMDGYCKAEPRDVEEYGDSY